MATVTIAPYPSWGDFYLERLRAHGMENTAAAEAGTTTRAVRKLCTDNSDFALAVEDALESSTDLLEAEARRRAVEGIDKGIYYQGDLVATEKQYSDSLLHAFLKAKRRREFGDKAELSGPGGSPLTVNIRTFGNKPAVEATLVEATTEAITDVAFRTLGRATDIAGLGLLPDAEDLV